MIGGEPKFAGEDNTRKIEQNIPEVEETTIKKAMATESDFNAQKLADQKELAELRKQLGMEPKQTAEPFLSGKVLKEGEFGIRELGNNSDKAVRTESMIGTVE